jgi:hypothetical protein
VQAIGLILERGKDRLAIRKGGKAVGSGVVTVGVDRRNQPFSLETTVFTRYKGHGRASPS